VKIGCLPNAYTVNLAVESKERDYTFRTFCERTEKHGGRVMFGILSIDDQPFGVAEMPRATTCCPLRWKAISCVEPNPVQWQVPRSDRSLLMSAETMRKSIPRQDQMRDRQAILR
jgi:hypothetical protein